MREYLQNKSRYLRQASFTICYYINCTSKYSYNIMFLLFQCAKTTGIISLMSDPMLSSKILEPTCQRCWKRILMRSTAPYRLQLRLIMCFTLLKNILVKSKMCQGKRIRVHVLHALLSPHGLSLPSIMNLHRITPGHQSQGCSSSANEHTVLSGILQLENERWRRRRP